MSYLYGARAQFIWGSQKMKALRTEVISYRNRDPNRVVVEYDAALTRYTFRLHVVEQMPSLRWGLQVGDCIQSLRSSLDLALFEVAARVGRSWPRPPAHERQIQFPICDKPGEFRKALWHLGDLRYDDTVRTRIESLQPYSRPNGAMRPALALLRDLNDGQKHRVINLVRTHRRSGSFTFNSPSGRTDPPIFTLRGGPLEHGAEIMSIRFDPPDPGVQVEDYPKFSFHPAIAYPVSLRAEAAKANNLVELGQLLGMLRAEVRYCLRDMSKLLVEVMGGH